MNLPRKCIAINALLLLASLFAAALDCAAQVAGKVTHLSGPLLARKADGTAKVLAQNSAVEQGDTLISEKDTYARIKFIDNSEITLRPNSQFRIDSFSFDETKPEKDSAILNLIKGGLRAVTGVLGKRNHERFGLNTPTATIGIRGTVFIAEYIAAEQPAVATYGFASVAAAPPMWRNGMSPIASDAAADVMPVEVLPMRLALNAPGTDGRAPGLYVQVLDGMINLRNSAGSQNFAAGQFGYTASLTQLPVVLPSNPGIKFAPPPAFSSAVASPNGTGSTNKAGDVDCEVR